MRIGEEPVRADVGTDGMGPRCGRPRSASGVAEGDGLRDLRGHGGTKPTGGKECRVTSPELMDRCPDIPGGLGGRDLQLAREGEPVAAPHQARVSPDRGAPRVAAACPLV